MQAAPICYYFACVKHWISLGKAFIGLCLAHAPFLKYLMGPSIPHELNTMLGVLQILSVSLTLL